KADSSGSIRVTSIMSDNEVEGNRFSRPEKSGSHSSEASGIPSYLAVATGSSSGGSAGSEFSGIDEGPDGVRLMDQEPYWMHRLRFPTGNYNADGLKAAVAQDSKVVRSVPSGRKLKGGAMQSSPLALSTSGFTALGPKPEKMTGCSGCFDYTTTAGRI